MRICVAFKEGRETWSLERLELPKPLRGLLPLRFPGVSLEDSRCSSLEPWAGGLLNESQGTRR